MLLYPRFSCIPNSSTLFPKGYLPRYSIKYKNVLLQQENELLIIRTNPSSKSSLTGQIDKFIIPHTVIYVIILAVCSRLLENAAIVKSPHVRESITASLVVWITRHGFRTLCYWNLDSGFQSVVLWVVLRNPKPRIHAQKFSGFLYMGRMKTWEFVDFVFVDCKQSLFFFNLLKRVHACASGEQRSRETQKTRAAAREENRASSVSCLQSRAWSFVWLARFSLSFSRRPYYLRPY